MKTFIILALAATLSGCVAGAKPDFQLDIRHSKKGTLDSPCMKAKTVSHNGDVMSAFFAYEKALHECGLRSEGLSVRRTDV